jgi:WD40 repeat protein
MFTTSDKFINVWDLRTFKSEITLKGHKDEIRQLHIHKDTLFSAGKGTVNGGSLLVWDLRGRMSFENIVEKEKNQDIFSMVIFFCYF